MRVLMRIYRLAGWPVLVVALLLVAGLNWFHPDVANGTTVTRPLPAWALVMANPWLSVILLMMGMALLGFGVHLRRTSRTELIATVGYTLELLPLVMLIACGVIGLVLYTTGYSSTMR